MSEALGAFVIGSTPLGTTPFNWAKTVLWQYQASPTILALVASLAEAIDPTLDLDTFYDYVWNIETAQGFGLDIWGRIVGVGRVYPIASGTYFGFEEATDKLGWNQGPFYGGGQFTTNYALSDTAFRQLILAKAQANILDGGTASINRLLMTMFAGRGNAYVIDGNDMSMTYAFGFALTPVDLTIIENSGVLPQPAGIVQNAIQHL